MSSEYLFCSAVLLSPGVTFTSTMLGCSCVHRDCDVCSMTGGMFTVVCVSLWAGICYDFCCVLCHCWLCILIFCTTTLAHVVVDGMFSGVLYIFGSGSPGRDVPTHCIHSRWRAARHMKQGPYGLL